MTYTKIVRDSNTHVKDRIKALDSLSKYLGLFREGASSTKEKEYHTWEEYLEENEIDEYIY